MDLLLNWVEAQPVFAWVKAAGHRVVHDMEHSEPERVTPKLFAELHRVTWYAPDHLPREIELIEAFQKRHPHLPQVACFDTAFHRAMLRVAKLLPNPRRYAAKGVERYGFHGLSYAYLMEELAASMPRPRKAASSSPIWAMGLAWPQCTVARASTRAWASRPRQD